MHTDKQRAPCYFERGRLKHSGRYLPDIEDEQGHDDMSVAVGLEPEIWSMNGHAPVSATSCPQTSLPTPVIVARFSAKETNLASWDVFNDVPGMIAARLIEGLCAVS